MAYDFDTLIDRRNTNSTKWDITEGELPLGLADMDFATAPEIIDAVMNKAVIGAYGYTTIPNEFAESVAKWWYLRHDWDIDPEWISYSIGIVPSISSLIRTFTEPDEKVVILAPAYNCFYSSVVNSSRTLLTSNLLYRKGKYSISWTDLEAHMTDPKATAFLLCNPHNPTGKVWSKEDLKRIGQLASDHGVLVISDEIHCDLTLPGVRYTPFASVDEQCAENSITLVSPTKAFNIAGLKTSAVIASNPDLRSRAQAGLNRDEVNEPNFFSVESSIAAFTRGEPWLTALRIYLRRNRERLTDIISREIPGLSVVEGQAMYLVWIDCSKIADDTTEFCEFLRAKTGLIVNRGAIYGEAGKKFIRVSIACPTSMLDEGLIRLKRGVKAWTAARG